MRRGEKNMKKMKKVLAMLLSFIMMMSMAMTTFAAGTTGSITYHTGKHNVSGVEFKAYRLMDATVSGEHVAYKINTDFANFFTDKIGTSTEKTNDELATDYLRAHVASPEFQTALKTFITTNKIQAKKTVTGSTEKTYMFSALEYGYYAIIPSGSQFAPSFTTVSKTEAQDVYLKGKTPDVDKKVDGDEWASAQIGDTLTFTVESMVPNMAGCKQYTFKLTDTMTNGLTVSKDTLNAKVKIGTTDLTSDQYTVNVVGQNITIEIKDFIKYKDQTNEPIVFTYEATLNENAVSKDPTTNTANVEYGNDPDHLTQGAPDTVVVKTHTLTINKKNDKDEMLAGAEFQLYRGIEVARNPISFVDLSDGKYRVAKPGEAPITDILLSPVGGVITVDGLDDGNYRLVETKAPNGYNQLKNPVEINITAKSDNKGDTITVTGNSVDVINNAGTLLPETGGMGTVIFTVVAIVLILGVAASFVFSRRRDRR